MFRELDIEFNPDINIIVGDNESGKSTLLEAINLALNGSLNGRSISYEVSQYLFNQSVVKEFVTALKNGERAEPPSILVELYLKDAPELASLKGTNNSIRANACGVSLSIALDDDYREEYAAFVLKAENASTLPVEYYSVQWHGFDFDPFNRRKLPIRSSLIDAPSMRTLNGADQYVRTILDTELNPKQRAELSLAYRALKAGFTESEAIKGINDGLAKAVHPITSRALSISVDSSARYGWESNLSTFIDDIPFQNIGKGEQMSVRTLMALEKRKDTTAVILIEEPENHLSHARMSALVDAISVSGQGNQLFITTHSAFILNKLGLDRLVLMNGNGQHTKLTSLDPDTLSYFKKLPGYNTLRLILAPKVVLCEGPSDELVIQRFYYDTYGKLPLAAGIDVLAVGALAFKRFLEVAKSIGKKVTVVLDNDGDHKAKVVEKYASFVTSGTAKLCFDTNDKLRTLEPQLLQANGLDVLNEVFGKDYGSDPEMLQYMKNNKTECALQIFSHPEPIAVPPYLIDAITE